MSNTKWISEFIYREYWRNKFLKLKKNTDVLTRIFSRLWYFEK